MCVGTAALGVGILLLSNPPVLAQTSTSGVKNALIRPQLNGMASYSNMSKTYYLVAFYTSQSCSDAQTCLEQQTPTRFLLKVVTPRWTASNYSLMWQTDLAINNQKPLEGDDIKALIDFTQLAETPLTVGDEIDVSYESQHTTVAVNKVIAIRTKNKTLFDYISRVWLGPTPPSKQFQADLLVGHDGPIDARLSSEFDQIKPSAKRMSLLDNWDVSKKNLPPKKTRTKLTPDQRERLTKEP
ncbi:MAG: chalcone isomerase family protein [Marinagarivorans sp.]|nr:chalcone isomerase family protein [Marinagarivorans sp.]